MPSPITPPFTLAPGTSATVTVRFTPSVAGVRTGSLYVLSNDPENSPAVVALSGTATSSGGTPAVTLSGFTTTLSFPDTTVG